MKNRIKLSIMTFLTTLMVSYPVYASQGEPVLVSGTKKLLAAVIGIVTGLVVSFITFQGLKIGSQWTNASPEEKPKYQKDLVATIIAGVVTLTIGSTITYIVGFYQG